MSKKSKEIALQAIISTFFSFLAVFIAPARIYVMTHSIDKETYGYFSLLTITLNSLGFVGILGLRYYLIYAFPNKSKTEQGRIFNSSLLVNLITGPLAALFFIGIVLTTSISNAFNTYVIVMGALYIIIYTLANLGLGYLLAVGRVILYKLLTFFTAYLWFAIVCVILICIRSGLLPALNLTGLTCSFILSLFAVFVVITFFTYKYLGKEGIKAKPTSTEAKASVLYGYPLLPQYFALALFRLADRYVILNFYDAATVATYTVAATLVFFSADTQMLLEYIFPHISEAWNKNLQTDKSGFTGQAAEYFYSALRLSIFMTVPMGIGLILWGTDVITLLAGKNYTTPELKYLFFIMAPLVPLMPLSKMFQFTINLDKKTKHVGISILIASILNLILNIIFIPKYGIIGAAGATTFSYTLLFISAVVMSSTQGFKLRKIKLTQIFTSAVLMTLSVLIIRSLFPGSITPPGTTLEIPIMFVEIIAAGIIYCLCTQQLKVWNFSELIGK